MVSNNLKNYGRRHFKIFSYCHVSWDTLYLKIYLPLSLKRSSKSTFCVNVYVRYTQYITIIYIMLIECKLQKNCNRLPYLPVFYFSICFSIWLFICLSICVSIWLFICLSICVSVWLFICLSICVSIWLYSCLSICVSIWL